MAYVPNSGSVVAFQSNPSVLQAVVLVTNLQGASISGTVNLGTQSGSVVAFQGTNPWLGTFSNSSIVALQLAGSVLATSATVTTGNSSVQLVNGSAIIGSVAGYLQSSGASIISVGQGSIAAVIIGGSILTSSTANQSVSGTVGASIVGQLPAGTAVLGSVATLQGTVPWIISSVYGNISGSVVAFQGSGWSGSVAATITNTNVNVSGSVVSSQGTNPWVIGSVVGTYSEDVASGNNDKGLLTLGIRNDTIASLVNADLDYTGWSTDSAGRHLIKPFSADEARLDTATSVVSTSVTALFTSVTGLRNYVTDIMIANTGSVASLITFKDGSTSILGYTIAPAGGGSNINGMQFPLRTAPGQDFTFTAATSSSVLYVTAKGYKGP